jgi:hypothetical protein
MFEDAAVESGAVDAALGVERERKGQGDGKY